MGKSCRRYGSNTIFKGMTMKGIKKYLFMLMALAAVFGFVACSDNDDDDYVPLPVAVYKANVTEYGDTGAYTLTFLSNGSFTIYESWTDEDYPYPETYLTYMGTYTGNPAEDAEIGMTITHILYEYDFLTPVPEEMKEYLSDIKVTISGGKFTLSFIPMAEFVKQ